jgi:hypothetical protein
LPSVGIQSTSTNIYGYSPLVKAGKQYESTPQFSIRAFNNTKAGFFVGFSTINSGFNVEFDKGSKFGMGNWVTSSRLEVGYQWTSPAIYLSGNKKDGINKAGLYLQIQPMLGVGYNFEPKGGYGGTGTSGSGIYKLNTNNNVHGNTSLLAGGNVYLGTRNKPFLFISVMQNMNFGSATQRGVLTTEYAGNSYTQSISTKGSGTSFSIGVPIRIGGKKKH